MLTGNLTTHHAPVLTRIAVIVIAIVLGHDTLMALPSHTPDSSAHDSHHEVAAEICVATDAQATATPGTPLLPPFAVPTVPLETTAIFAFVETNPVHIFAIDGATQRALLQVFLN